MMMMAALPVMYASADMSSQRAKKLKSTRVHAWCCSAPSHAGATGDEDAGPPRSNKLFVGKIGYQMTEQDLKALFTPFGTVTNTIIIRLVSE